MARKGGFGKSRAGVGGSWFKARGLAAKHRSAGRESRAPALAPACLDALEPRLMLTKYKE